MRCLAIDDLRSSIQREGIATRVAHRPHPSFGKALSRGRWRASPCPRHLSPRFSAEDRLDAHGLEERTQQRGRPRRLAGQMIERRQPVDVSRGYGPHLPAVEWDMRPDRRDCAPVDQGVDDVLADADPPLGVGHRQEPPFDGVCPDLGRTAVLRGVDRPGERRLRGPAPGQPPVGPVRPPAVLPRRAVADWRDRARGERLHRVACACPRPDLRQRLRDLGAQAIFWTIPAGYLPERSAPRPVSRWSTWRPGSAVSPPPTS